MKYHIVLYCKNLDLQDSRGNCVVVLQKVSADSQSAVERISRGTSFPFTLEAEAALVLRVENFVAREMVSLETTL